MRRIALAVALIAIMCAVSYVQRDAEAQAPAPVATSCPGQTAPAPIATGVYTQKPVPEIMINGAPAPGAIWKAGDRAYWHCHTGGQEDAELSAGHEAALLVDLSVFCEMVLVTHRFFSFSRRPEGLRLHLGSRKTTGISCSSSLRRSSGIRFSR